VRHPGLPGKNVKLVLCLSIVLLRRFEKPLDGGLIILGYAAANPLEKDPSRQYQSATEIYIDLERIAHPTSAGASNLRAISEAAEKDVVRAHPRVIKPWKIGAALLAILAVTSVVCFLRPRSTNSLSGTSEPATAWRKSIAVWGFKNLSGKSEQNWMSEAIVSTLASRSSTPRAEGRQLRDTRQSLPAMAEPSPGLGNVTLV